MKCLLASVLMSWAVWVAAQSEAVNVTVSGSKTITHVDHLRLQDELNALFVASDLTASDVTALTSAVNGLSWADVLSQGASADRDIDLGFHDLDGARTISVALVLADTLAVTKVINGQIGSLANHSSDALSEGSTNQYFTLTRSRNAITLSDAGGDGSLTYNGTTGEFTYTGPSAAEVRAHFSAGTGVEITDGGVSIGQAVGTADDVTFGSVTATFTGDLTGDVTGTVSSLSNHTTDALAEGSNLYFTDSRADGRIAAASVTDLSDVTDAGSGAIITETERDLLAALNDALVVIDGLQTASNNKFSCGDPYFFNGYGYATVEIGTQCWFAENLRSTHYNDESEIPSGLTAAEWENADESSLGATAVYGEGDSPCYGTSCDEMANLQDYGRLYNWYAVNSGMLCPSGWHVPTDGELTDLTNYLGGASDAGVTMKASPTDSPSWNGTNSSGYSALPGGYRFSDGNFYSVGSGAYFWSSSPSGSNAWIRKLYSGSVGVDRNYGSQRNGFSVRCVRD